MPTHHHDKPAPHLGNQRITAQLRCAFDICLRNEHAVERSAVLVLMAARAYCVQLVHGDVVELVEGVWFVVTPPPPRNSPD